MVLTNPKSTIGRLEMALHMEAKINADKHASFTENGFMILWK